MSWADFDSFWRNFNRTYILVYTDAQVDTVKALVGQDMDDTAMYAHSAARLNENMTPIQKTPLPRLISAPRSSAWASIKRQRRHSTRRAY